MNSRRDFLQAGAATVVGRYTPVHLRSGATCRCDNPQMTKETNGSAYWLTFVCANCGGRLDRPPVEEMTPGWYGELP